MVGRVMQAAATSSGPHKTSLGPALSQAKAAVLREVGSGALRPLDPLLEEEDDAAAANTEAREALAARLLAVVVAGAADDAPFRAWVEGLWAAAGLGGGAAGVS